MIQQMFMARRQGIPNVNLPASISVADTNADPASSTATWRINQVAGEWDTPAGIGSPASGIWLPGGQATTDYEFRIVTVSGSPTSSSFTSGTWYAGNTSGSVSVVRNPPPGTQAYSFTLEFRAAVGGAAKGSCPVDMTAEVVV